MKLIISTTGTTLDSTFDPRFGRAANFCLVDIETGEVSGHDNPAISASGGAGVLAAQFITKLGAQAVVSGAYGPNAFDTLSPAGVKMYINSSNTKLSAREVVDLYKQGKLTESTSATHEGYHGGHA